MRGGRFDRIIKIQSGGTGTRDASGQFQKTWTDRATTTGNTQIYARMWMPRGDERYLSQQDVSKASVVFEVRRNKDFTISVKDRIVLIDESPTRNFQIKSILDLGRRGAEALQMITEEILD